VLVGGYHLYLFTDLSSVEQDSNFLPAPKKIQYPYAFIEDTSIKKEKVFTPM
jgi:hypothetical protein